MAKASFEQILERLGKVVDQLEDGDLSLEKSLEAFRSGVDLAKEGATRLQEMERKVELIMKELGGEESIPFELEADEE